MPLTGAEHQPIHGGAGPEDLQGSTVCEEHRESDEGGRWKAEDGDREPSQSQPKELSGTCPAVSLIVHGFQTQ